MAVFYFIKIFLDKIDFLVYYTHINFKAGLISLPAV